MAPVRGYVRVRSTSRTEIHLYQDGRACRNPNIVSLCPVRACKAGTDNSVVYAPAIPPCVGVCTETGITDVTWRGVTPAGVQCLPRILACGRRLCDNRFHVVRHVWSCIEHFIGPFPHWRPRSIRHCDGGESPRYPVPPGFRVGLFGSRLCSSGCG